MKLVLSDKEKKKHVVELGFVKGMITGVPSMTYLTSESVGCILRNAENINEMCHGTIIGDKAVVFHMLATFTYAITFGPLISLTQQSGPAEKASDSFARVIKVSE